VSQNEPTWAHKPPGSRTHRHTDIHTQTDRYIHIHIQTCLSRLDPTHTDTQTHRHTDRHYMWQWTAGQTDDLKLGFISITRYRYIDRGFVDVVI